MINRHVALFLCLLTVACDDTSKTEDKNVGHDSLNQNDAPKPGRGVVDARKWNMADFSDFFDENVTIDKVRETFGPEGRMETDGDIVELVYEFDSDKLFEHGARMHIMKVFFEKGELLNVSIQFARLSDF